MEQQVETFLHTFRGLGTRGKPQPHEHTTLAGISIRFDDTYAVKETLLGESCVFVAMATGTKCIPASSRCQHGSTVHDGHAEVLVRRVFNRWLLQEIGNCLLGERSLIFEKVSGASCVCLRDGVTFELMISSLPCGDASIIDVDGRKRDRTGAKVVPNGRERLPEAHEVESYSRSQACGLVRRKPGKGSPTSSVSCSDKILKWNLLGFQGCLMLPLVRKPLYFRRITALVCDDGGGAREDTAASKSMHRALWERACNLQECLKGSSFMREAPPILISISVRRNVLEEHGLVASTKRKVSPGISAMWWAKASKDWKAKEPDYISHIPKGDKNYCEIIIGKTGVKMGFQKPTLEAPVCHKARSRVSRASMRDLVQQVSKSQDDIADAHTAPYESLKVSLSPEYVHMWNRLRQPGSVLSNWIRKS